jgi:predicted nucleic acid-binding protein
MGAYERHQALPAIDGLLAATALSNGLTLVTRNDRDVAGLGATVFNPFKGADSDHRS